MTLWRELIHGMKMLTLHIGILHVVVVVVVVDVVVVVAVFVAGETLHCSLPH